ncbi:RNA-binding domain-containing protein [Pleurostoma richardsiae]|uniref:RNA-binding domain-containing protein n=1 Tax=Pleurostoma richardsiae TaxID=41990 RepID=A0AA38R3G9_9PEZI|nr:RNA-binding domain-containing protein [Pleurostoma richardsiae]
MAKSAGQKRRREAEAIQEQKAAETQGEDAHPSKKSRVEEKRSLFVRSLPPTATSEGLTEFFSQHYPVKHATVVVDPSTKKSRGYGFVTFTDADDALEAKEKLNNELWEGRRLRLDVAEPRNRVTGGGKSEASSKVAEKKKQREQELEEARKPPKLIIRNLPWSVKTSADLVRLFQSFGKVKYADLPQSKGKLAGFGFVTMRGKKNAEKAMEAVNGKQIDGRTLAVDWAVSKEVWEMQKGNEGTVEEKETRDDVDNAEGSPDAKPKAKKIAAQVKMSQADADLQNFMQNHMENLEEEEGESEEEDDDAEANDSQIESEDIEEETDERVPEGKPKRLTDNSTTIFIRNLPFTTGDEDLKLHFKAHFGPVRYARVVMDRATERPAGTGFVCFVNMDDFKACLKGAPRHQPVTSNAKHSVLQNELVDPEGKYTIDGRVLQLASAVSKDEATRLAEDGVSARKGQDRDKRRLYLLSEGTIAKGSPLYALLSPAEVKLRETSAAQRKKLIEGNPSLHLSLTRLAVRNIPRNMNSKELKALAREAVVGFAKDAREGRRQPLSKEELRRGGEQEKEAEERRKAKKKGIVSQAKIVFETKEGSKTNEEGGKSRGYGFIEYSSHRLALMGLRWLNGHALKNEAGKTVRLVVEFAIENANVISRRKAAEERARTRAHGGGRDNDEGGQEAADGPKGRKQVVRREKGRKPRDEEEGAGQKEDPPPTKDAAAKLAMRQRIIGRKRMIRKKKASTRRAT